MVLGDRRLQWAAGDTRGDSRDLDYFFLAAITPVGIGGGGSRRRIRYDSFEEGERRMWPHDSDATQMSGRLIPVFQRGEDFDPSRGAVRSMKNSRDGRRLLWVDICRRVPGNASAAFRGGCSSQWHAVETGMLGPRIAEAARQPRR